MIEEKIFLTVKQECFSIFKFILYGIGFLFVEYLFVFFLYVDDLFCGRNVKLKGWVQFCAENNFHYQILFKIIKVYKRGNFRILRDLREKKVEYWLRFQRQK